MSRVFPFLGERQYRIVRGLICAAGIALIVALRLLWLDSDAYARLSWSSALLTDEGFYIHNARNVILFGTPRTDGFNNMLIMPLLHVVQVGVFSLWGVGAVQARLISVVCSLLTLVLFFALLRRVGGARVAWVGTLLLGLEHSFLLYNRLALMDTPALLPLVAALYTFVRAAQAAESAQRLEVQTSPRSFGWQAAVWLASCGLLLITAYAVRGLVMLAVPAAAVAWWVVFPRSRRALWGMGMGMAIAGLVYFFLWYGPHHAELVQANRYYVGVQLFPHSARQLLHNMGTACWHWERGLFPYLFKHTPLLFGLAVWACWPNRRSQATKLQANALDCSAAWRATHIFAQWWFVSLMLFCVVVNYAPSRYYVLFYPPMVLLATGQIAGLLAAWTRSTRRAALAFLAGCVLINTAWMADWMLHITYRQKQADQWLAKNLPANSVLFGDVAPGLCLNNRFRVVNVIAKFCNDDHPLERVSGVPRYIVILDRNRTRSNWREKWWDRHYPAHVAGDRRKHAFRGLLRNFFTVGVYKASEG